MNKVFKIIWNKTTQSFVVTSELAKGAVKASSNSEQRVASETRLSSLFKLSAFALSLSAVMMPAQAVDLSDPLIKITTGPGKVVRGEYLERGKSAVNFYIVFDLYKDDSMLIITDFGLILMSILFTQTIPCIENVNFL